MPSSDEQIFIHQNTEYKMYWWPLGSWSSFSYTPFSFSGNTSCKYIQRSNALFGNYRLLYIYFAFHMSRARIKNLRGRDRGVRSPTIKIKTSLNLPSKVTEESLGPPTFANKIILWTPWYKFLDPHMRLWKQIVEIGVNNCLMSVTNVVWKR